MLTKINFQSASRKLYTFCAVTILFVLPFLAKGQVISGLISDEQNNPVPYATIFVKETKEGTTSNVDGKFQLQLPKGNYNLTIRSMGFYQKSKEVGLQTDSLNLPITLKVQKFELKEVKVFPGKEDPAYFIMRKAMAKAPFYRNKIKHYSADLYIKSNFEFTNIPKLYQNKIELDDGKKLKDYFKENVTYVIESQNKITYDYPDTYDQKVISKKTSLVGIDEPPVMGLITTSIYEERPFQAISPLSSVALKHYNFQYEGYITVGDFDVFKIKVTPKRKSNELLDGYMYIVDRLWCVYNLDLNSSFEFFNFRIKQQYQNLDNDNWLPVSYNISGNISMLGLRGNFYYGSSVKYDSIVENYQSKIQQEIDANQVAKENVAVREKSDKEKELTNQVNALSAKEKLSNADVKKVSRLNRKILKEQYRDSTIVASTFNSYNIEDKKDSLQNNIVWDTIRAIPLTPAEIQSYRLADSIVALETMDIDSLSADDKKKKQQSKFNKLLFGHYDLCKDSSIRLGYPGLISTENFDFNAVDGYKYKQSLRFRINPDSGKYVYITPELSYAFNRKALFGSVETLFINVLADGNSFGFKAGKQSNDFKNQNIGISPALNAISTWFFAENYMKLYETGFVYFAITQRIKKGFTVLANANYDHFYPLENHASYLWSDNKVFSPNIPKGLTATSSALQEQKSFSYALGFEFKQRQRKPWLEESPFLFIDDFYTLRLNYKQGITGIFDSESDFNQLDLSWHQQANISQTAGIDWHLNAGYFFNNDQMHFSQYHHFKTAEIPVLLSSFTNTFQLLNDYEFSTNKSYITLGAEYRTEYILLRYFSFINRKTWSESLHFNYLSTPALENYWEAGYSLNSLFFAGNIGVFTGFKGSDFESVSLKVSISVFD
ncbi:DUF5686 and carboxypeptidase regulatory-like domain-containing protein [uncultured Draconibacterium sp.]|uniref:DUF5686 and carboxypeptidase regulatory-like domain-containing protein n=1 Tax=uncultured Draconibacterium sp. TaxID=1573823 RepID=UPI00321716BE